MIQETFEGPFPKASTHFTYIKERALIIDPKASLSYDAMVLPSKHILGIQWLKGKWYNTDPIKSHSFLIDGEGKQLDFSISITKKKMLHSLFSKTTIDYEEYGHYTYFTIWASIGLRGEMVIIAFQADGKFLDEKYWKDMAIPEKGIHCAERYSGFRVNLNDAKLKEGLQTQCCVYKLPYILGIPQDEKLKQEPETWFSYNKQ